MPFWLALPLALPLALATPPVAPLPAPPVADAEARIAIGEQAARMTVPVHIDGAGPYRFVIDTGAQRTVISRQLAEALRLAPGRRVRLTDMAGVAQVATVRIPSIRVSVIGGQGIEAPALDADHLGAAGMLGIDTLQKHVVAIDFERQEMRVTPARLRPRRAAPAPRAPGEVVVQARSLLGQLVVTDAWVGGTKVRVIIDTGAAVSMGNEALRRRALGNRRGAPVLIRSVTGGDVTADQAMLRGVRIGKVGVDGLPVAIADVAPFAAFGVADRPAILLGMDALRLFRRVEIDFANRELRMLVARPNR